MDNKKLGRKELRKYKDELIYKYVEEKKSSYEIAKEYNTYNCTVLDILKENGVHGRSKTESNRKYELDTKWFDVINTQEKAYVFGFICADGTVSSSGRCVFIQLADYDEEILIKMAKASNNTIPIRDAKSNDREKREKELGHWYRGLYWNSIEIVKSLEEKGVVHNKSLILKFPNCISEELMPHFVRGYYDGDGSLCRSGNGINIKITSSCYFNIELEKIFNSFNWRTKLNYTENGITTNLCINYQDDVKAFLEWIYKDASIYLERKRNRYLEFLKTGKVENYDL